MNGKTKTVMVFGVFDVIHDGHRHFLENARKLGRLIAVVAPDASVLALKGSLPLRPLAKRLKSLQSEALADEVTAGDGVLGSWRILSRYLPNTIALGYDQIELAKALGDFIVKNKLPVKLVTISPHSDKTLHSSALRKKL